MMTKKRWKGGRPKKQNVSRYPGGQIKAVAPTPELLRRRAELVGEGRAEDPRASWPLGVLLLLGRITERQYEAGVRFRTLDARYSAIKGLPPRHPRCVSLDELRAGNDETAFDAEEWERLRVRFMEVSYTVQSLAGPQAWWAVVEIVLFDMWNTAGKLDDLVSGLDRIADFYKVPKDTKCCIDTK